MGTSGSSGEAGVFGSTGGRGWCPVALPWFGFIGGHHPLDDLRRLVYRIEAQRHRSRLRRGLRLVRYMLTWPVLAARNAWRAVRRWGAAVHAHGGVPRWQQFLRLYWLGLRWNILPETSYAFRLHEPRRFRRAPDFLQEFEGIRLFEHLHDPALRQSLHCKHTFYRTCRRHALPTPPVLAVIGPGGRVQWEEGHGRLPAHDLFVKPTDGSSGHGVQRWCHDAATGCWQRHGLSLDADALLGHFARLAGNGRLLVQPRLHNARVLRGLAPVALASLRVVTWKGRDQAAEVFGAFFRMPVGGAEADNYSAGGIAAALSATGTLGPARPKRAAGPYDRHPDSEAAITGTVLPEWQAQLALARQAHDTLGFRGCVGWDIVLTDDGPLIGEVNPVWGFLSWQASTGVPLGATALPDILRRLLAERGVAGSGGDAPAAGAVAMPMP